MGLDRGTHALDLVRAEIVYHHDVARPQGWRQRLLDIGPETCAVDRAVGPAGRGAAGATERSDQGRGPARRPGLDARTPRSRPSGCGVIYARRPLRRLQYRHVRYPTPPAGPSLAALLFALSQAAIQVLAGRSDLQRQTCRQRSRAGRASHGTSTGTRRGLSAKLLITFAAPRPDRVLRGGVDGRWTIFRPASTRAEILSVAAL